MCGSFEHLQKQVKSVADRQTLQREAIRGGEAKSLPYLLAQMNLLLHGLENPQIDFENSLARALGEITERDRVDLILTNPPFGGEEQRAILSNFPADRQTAETAWLFLQLIMRLLKRPQAAGLAHRRAAVVVPNGTLFSDGVGALIKKDLLAEFNLRTIVRLPPGVFAPYTNIQANILFFDCSGPTQNVWFYEMAPPAGRKNYSKTAPIQFEEFADCMAWWLNRVENERAWKVDWAKLHHDTEEKALAHREAEENAKEAASQAARRGREIESQLTALDRENGLFADAERAKRIEKLRQQRTALKKREIEAREEAKAEKATFDAIYWPIFNLDLKNPRAPQDAAHLPPAELLASIRQKEARLTGLLDEIGALLETAP